MRNPLLLVVGVAMGVSMLYFWYCEMFSDGYIGWFERFFNRIRWRGEELHRPVRTRVRIIFCSRRHSISRPHDRSQHLQLTTWP